MTICKKCKNFKMLNKNNGADCWYNHVCKANKLPVEIDPIDGREKPCSYNDLGDKYFSEDKYEYCRDINNGNCQNFIPKKTILALRN